MNRTCYSNTLMHKSIHTVRTPAGNLDLHAKNNSFHTPGNSTLGRSASSSPERCD